MKTKKLLSILLALMMILSVVPFYASAEAETLTASNIQTLPTITVNDLSAVKLYTGTYPDKLFTIADDEVVVDAAGNQVAGHFVVRNASAYDAGEAVVKRLNITFLPDDTEAYTSFNKNRITVDEFTIVVEKADVALIDAENDYPRTTEAVPSGTAISDIRITGGGLYNVQNPTSNTYLSNASWSWKDTSLVVTESGYYDAVSSAPEDAFNDFVLPVYIEVESSIEATTIVEAPTATLEYGQYFSEAVFEGGKVMAGDTEVSGTFTRKSTSIVKPIVGVFDAVEVIFTPDDLEKYAPCEGTAVVTVTKANYKFVNENGEEIVPELTLPYGTTFDIGGALGVALKLMIKDRNNVSSYDTPVISFPDYDKDDIAPIGTNTYNVRIRPYSGYEENTNYNVTDLQFVLTIEPVTVEMKLAISIDKEQTINIRTVNSNDPYPQGTFDIYVDGALYMEDVKGNFPFDPGKSGKYDIKMVYNPVENDPCVVEEKTVTWTETYHRNLNRGNLVMGSTATVMYGKEVKLSANIPEENFGGWKITDAKGNEVVLEDAVMEGRDITFTMPDFDITVEAIDKSADTSGDGIDDIFGNLGDLTEGDSDNPFENIINNLVAFFKNIINTIKNFFRGIGDLT